MARIFSDCKAKLILSGRNQHALEELADELECATQVLPFDLTNFDEMNVVAKKALMSFGKIDVLVNNGGQGCRSLVRETAIEVDEQIMKVNYLGNIALAKAVLPEFLAQGRGQYIVVSSLAGKFGTKSRSAYAASKHALHGFYESLLAETYEEGVRVTIACPGFVDTQLLERSWDGDGQTVPTTARTNKRMTAAKCAHQIIRAASQEKEEVIIGESFKERISVDIKRLFPGIFSNMMRKANVN